jgi:import inner membrane translocase subunit TIM17
VKGARNSPAGARITGSMYAIKVRAPTLGGQFAIWGALFSSFDCTLAYVRRKEDPWNAISAGALTGGTLAMRAGYKTAMKNALFGGLILALIEGCGILLTKYMVPPEMLQEDVTAPGAPISFAAPTTHTTIPSPTTQGFDVLPDQETRSSFK